MKRLLLPGLIASLFAGSAHAFDPFVIKDIRVEGIQRTEAGTVFTYLPVKVGDTFNDDQASASVKALFATGFFKDVRIEIDGGVLVVVLDERPAIASVNFVGLKAFDKEKLDKGMKDVGLAESRIFDRSLLDKAEQELKRQYISKGYYGVEVTTTVTPLERNRVGLSFNVTEGDISKIRQINIVGNQAFSESDLLDLFALQTPNWFSWYTKNDQYSKEKLSGDLENLRSFYLDRGYLEFAVTSTQVSITPDKKDIYITLSVSEGEKFNISSVKLAGDLILPEEELTKLIKVKPGEIYSREKMADSTKAISDRLGNEGYAFANVNAVPDLDKEKKDVAFSILVDPGRRVYVRNINISGNTRTRDEVIRRELRQMESAWYDGDKINRSKTRADKLGYFEEVTVETPAVPAVSDQVDVNLAVKEKATGSISVGAGYSSAERLVLQAGIQQQNLFGSGNSVGFQVSTSRINTVYSVSFTDPYYTVDGVARGFDFYHRNTDTAYLSLGAYGTRSTGGGVRFGIPIGEEDYLSVGLSGDITKLKLIDTSPQRFLDYVNQNGDWSSTVMSSAGWAKDTVDSRIYPTKGYISRISAQLALPGGLLRYYQTNFMHQRYFSVWRDYVVMLKGDFSLVHGYGGHELPFYKNLYAGGVDSVRAYDTASLGPIDPTTNSRLGGNKRFVGNAEFLLPMPGMGKDKSVRLGAFFDAGQVWGADQKVSAKDLRYSTGLSLTWGSPMGPLKFSFGIPLNKKPEDMVQRLQFTVGTVF